MSGLRNFGAGPRGFGARLQTLKIGFRNWESGLRGYLVVASVDVWGRPRALISQTGRLWPTPTGGVPVLIHGAGVGMGGGCGEVPRCLTERAVIAKCTHTHLMFSVTCNLLSQSCASVLATTYPTFMRQDERKLRAAVTGGGALRPPRSPAPEPRSLAVKVWSPALKVWSPSRYIPL